MKVAIAIFFSLFCLLGNSQSELDEMFMNAYVVIADTSSDYHVLRNEMFELSESLSMKIDTMERGFNEAKNLICFPLNHEDEMYAGEYYPRRYTSEWLSLEYYEYYSDVNQRSGTIALVAAITESKEHADSLSMKIQKYAKGAFVVQSRIFIGCMH